MEEYVCKYLISRTSVARAAYHAPNLATAMAMHNSALPDYSTQVVSWIGPTGITFQMHDSTMTL